MNSGKIIRGSLITLPVGLAIIGIASLTYTTIFKPQAKELEASTANRGPVVSVSGIRETDLEDYLQTLTVRIGERHYQKPQMLEATKFYLESTLGISNFGYQVKEQNYQVDGQTFTNVEVEIPGTKWPEQIVVVGAHYDTAKGTPGADDNASGVAALLALAQSFSGKQQSRTLRFVAFVNEEPPFFETPDMGSYRYAERCKNDGDRIVAMISLESMGYFSDEPRSQKYPDAIAYQYPRVGNFIGVVGNLKSRKLVDFFHASLIASEAIPAEKGAFPEMIEGIGWSDHWAFWQFDYPAIMITDTAPFRNPNYHKSTDTLETLDLPRLTQSTIASRKAIEDLANVEKLSWVTQMDD
ncbi:MAG: M28 family peptidase [Verrucomicrobiota bacterium]